MKIPEPARRGWTDVLECVDEVFRTREGKRGWALHGGTLLAMRWDGHRESTDIDLLIGADAVTTLWEMVDGPRLAELDERLGRRGMDAAGRPAQRLVARLRARDRRGQDRSTPDRAAPDDGAASGASGGRGDLVPEHGAGACGEADRTRVCGTGAGPLRRGGRRTADAAGTGAGPGRGRDAATRGNAEGMARSGANVRGAGAGGDQGGKGRGHRGAAGGRGRDRVCEVLDADLSGLAGRGRMENHGTGAWARSESGVAGGRGRSATRPGGADAGRGEGEGGGGDGKRPAGWAGDGGYGESGQRTDGEGGTPSGTLVAADDQFYKRFAPLADRLYDEHLKKLKEEGLIE